METLSNAMAIMQTYGPWLLAVVFFVWRDYRREERMTGRIEKLENDYRDVLLPLTRECVEVVSENTQVIKRLKSELGW